MSNSERLLAGEMKAILSDVPDYYEIFLSITGTVDGDATAGFAREVEIDHDISGPYVEHGILRLRGKKL